MKSLRTYILLVLTACAALAGRAQTTYRLAGRVVDDATGQAVEFASLLVEESGQWAVSDEKGAFTIKSVPAGRLTLSVQCLGYQKRTWPMTIQRDVDNLTLRISQQNLKLQEVTVVARRKQDEATTSYTIGRQALDQQQVLNLSDITTLLPGGKTVNPTLMSDQRIALRSAAQEKGNAAFGTAIEIDGMRMDNNAMMGETTGASTRTVSAANIESVEVVAGIASVEYGDLSNGVVKVNTRRGKSPFIVEGKLNQHTRQVALNKGFELGARSGVLNVSMEHARSFSDAASPHTAYQRNVLTANYMNILMRESTPLTLNVGVTANVGGYNSEADPDNELDDYQKVRDNALRAHVDLQWLLNKPWITNAQLSASIAYSDRRSESYTHANSASTQPYLHATEEGYYIGAPPSVPEGEAPPSAPEGATIVSFLDSKTIEAPSGAVGGATPIILGPTGYWYVLGFNDSKPLSWQTKLKADWTRRVHSMTNRLMVGTQYSGSRNNGRGTYYDDMSVAPTWREYRYYRLPTMHNVAFYVEDKIIIPASIFRHKSDQTPLPWGGVGGGLELTAGLRNDLTVIPGSDYGTAASLSPRANARYVFWRQQRKRWVSDLEVHAGWGKSTKLPSFQVLYPSPSYSDLQVFASTSTADNRAYYAFHVYPMQAHYNPDLQWQYTNQTDLGVELSVKGTRISLSGFHHKTCRSYLSMRTYTPFAYRYTGQASVQGSAIPVADRTFTIDRQTGIVTMHDATGQQPSLELPGTERHTWTTQQHFANATPLERYGLEWIIDFAQIRALRTQLRLDGNYYQYRGTDDVLFADVPLGVNNITASGQPYQYVGYYRGTNVTSAGASANAAVANGSLARQANLNATLTTHLPRVRMIVSLRLETSLLNYRRSLSELASGPRGYVLPDDDQSGYFGEPYTGAERDRLVVVYPEYYATWEHPDELLPFAERFAWARDNDQALYSDLSKLVVRSNYAYTMNPNRMSRYCSANLSVTKEIGDHVSLSFYANNFFNNMRRIRSSQTDLETSLFDSGYIPNYYYGLSLKLIL
ncbi:MAG: TonB-dependent receptor [Prevotella sp.]|nr:TonB-dependent receptor [Prevotella sp.]